ncbi:Formyltransferase [Pleomassaria siparia CBS 279.74]|uniref:methionyl-tRNA formyltransferase n=1 Tax=Pleomassaria siparia CBS 279.74 TaxID=1314801 RepID=A0A6G1K9R9_9PLEO|nr:Formyltransferase [Pleomassaria siparia CBS 279.74]
MLWRLPVGLRPLVPSNCHSYSTVATPTPLRILFCGSDDFSIASLRALSRWKRDEPKRVKSIDVVHRPGKRTGRGLKIIKEVPIKRVALEELQLNTHEIDTFTGWTPPNPFDIIIAVSFGLLVPPRLLNAAKFGGVNVHPSLLPDLSGPAPIHHTLLKHRTKTGVTVQTLHPKYFDRGRVLAQTPSPGIDVPERTTVSALTTILGDQGAEMLVNVLGNADGWSMSEDAGWYQGTSGPVEHAGKIDKTHTYVDFATATAGDILIRHHVLGDLWCVPPQISGGERIILNEIDSLDVADATDCKPGLFIPAGSNTVAIRTVDGKVLHVKSCTLPGGKKGGGNARLVRLLA